jgi:hypothetical protein
MFWPIERAREVLHAWREWVETVPDELTSAARILHFPPLPDIPEPLRGGSFAVVDAVFAGPECEGARLVEPLRALEPVMDTFAVGEARSLLHLHMDPPKPVPAAGDGMFLDELPLEAIDEVVENAEFPLLPRALGVRADLLQLLRAADRPRAALPAYDVPAPTQDQDRVRPRRAVRLQPPHPALAPRPRRRRSPGVPARRNGTRLKRARPGHTGARRAAARE